MRKAIRLGDETSHGGKVVSATSHITIGGIPVARLGDKCTCPKRGHNNCVIAEVTRRGQWMAFPSLWKGTKLPVGRC